MRTIHRKVPTDIWNLISEFYQNNRDYMVTESWPRANTYTNHWDSPTQFLSVDNTKFAGGGPMLKQRIWDGMKPILEEWVHEKLVPTSLYGIRIYRNNSMLSTRKCL